MLKAEIDISLTRMRYSYRRTHPTTLIPYLLGVTLSTVLSLPSLSTLQTS
jgi:hypothetical protein